MDDIKRREVQKGSYVDILIGEELVRGYVKRMLPRQSDPRDIEVELMSGEIGLVYHLVTKSEYKVEKFKFYNLFLHSRNIVTIWDKERNEFFVEPLRNPAKKRIEKTAYLFSDDAIAKKFLKELERDELAIRRISRRRTIKENFKKSDIDIFRLNEERKVSAKKLDELERYYNMM